MREYMPIVCLFRSGVHHSVMLSVSSTCTSLRSISNPPMLRLVSTEHDKDDDLFRLSKITIDFFVTWCLPESVSVVIDRRADLVSALP